MIEVQVLIPVANNEGQTFPAQHHDEFETFALGLFGGVTRLPNEAIGAWADAGRIYRDQFRLYVVALASITGGGKVGELATFAKSHYGQAALYVRYLSLSEVL